MRARRRMIRITSTTARISGTSSLLSRAEAARRSCSSAVGPPTVTSVPPACFTALRSGSITSKALVE